MIDVQALASACGLEPRGYDYDRADAASAAAPPWKSPDPATVEIPDKWPWLLAQDISRELSQWFASRADARRCVREAPLARPVVAVVPAAAAGQQQDGEQQAQPSRTSPR